ncbi:hypothetical protein Tco_0837665 [Tanacetum coccineum]
MLKKFGLEDSKPTKTPMSTDIKLTKEDEAYSVNSSKYQENRKTTHLEAIKRIFRSALAQSSGITTRPKLFANNSGEESDDDNDACVEILLITPILFAVDIASRNQGGGSAAPAAEGPSTRDSRGKGIMTDAAIASFEGASHPRLTNIKNYRSDGRGDSNHWPLIYLKAQISSYTFGHLEVFELAACLEKLHFPVLLVMSKFSRICLSFDFKSALHHESSL